MQKILSELKNNNELLNNLELLSGIPTLSSIPSHLEIEFTNACNLRCYMCYQSRLKIDYSQIEDKTLNDVVKILPYVRTILIAGLGEQLLYQRLCDFLEIAKYYSCEINMFTNGQLVHKCINVFKHISLLTVSFDGATQDVFETQRYGANFYKILHNIKLLRVIYPEMQIRLGCVLSKLNINQIEDIAKIANDIGVNIVSFSHVQHTPLIELTRSDYPILKNNLKKVLEFSEKNSIVIEFNNIEYLNSLPICKEVDRGRLLSFVQKESKDRELQKPKDIKGLQRIVSSCRKKNKLDILSVKEIKKINNYLNYKIFKTEKIIRERRINYIAKPYCLSLWNYAFIKMSGKFRLCPYFDLEAGSINKGISSKGLNNIRLIQIRETLLRKKNLLPVCQSCPDQYHREFKYEAFKRVCDKFGISIGEE